MEIYKAFAELVNKPNAIKSYKRLRDLFLNQKMNQEAEAFDLLIEQKFKKNEKFNNDTYGSEE